MASDHFDLDRCIWDADYRQTVKDMLNDESPDDFADRATGPEYRLRFGLSDRG